MNRWRVYVVMALLSISISLLGYISARGIRGKDAQIEYHVQQAAELQQQLDRLEAEVAKELALKKLEHDIVQCESGGKHEGVWGDDGKSFGICQYQRLTFYEDAKLAGIRKPSWFNKEHQLIAFRAALRRGEEKQWWNCYQKAKEGI